MKVKTSIKKLCPACYITRYNKKNYVRCPENPRHKQRQRFSTAKPVNYTLQYSCAEFQSKPIKNLIDLII